MLGSISKIWYLAGLLLLLATPMGAARADVLPADRACPGQSSKSGSASLRMCLIAEPVGTPGSGRCRSNSTTAAMLSARIAPLAPRDGTPVTAGCSLPATSPPAAAGAERQCDAFQALSAYRLACLKTGGCDPQYLRLATRFIDTRKAVPRICF